MSTKEEIKESDCMTCSKCYRVGTKYLQLRRCSRCFLVAYCSVTCQKQHWKEHKTICSEKPANQEEGQECGRVKMGPAKIASDAVKKDNTKSDMTYKTVTGTTVFTFPADETAAGKSTDVSVKMAASCDKTVVINGVAVDCRDLDKLELKADQLRKKCWRCNTRRSKEVHLMRCPNCQLARYCSDHCLNEDKQKHKKDCKLAWLRHMAEIE